MLSLLNVRESRLPGILQRFCFFYPLPPPPHFSSPTSAFLKCLGNSIFAFHDGPDLNIQRSEKSSLAGSYIISGIFFFFFFDRNLLIFILYFFWLCFLTFWKSFEWFLVSGFGFYQFQKYFFFIDQVMGRSQGFLVWVKVSSWFKPRQCNTCL